MKKRLSDQTISQHKMRLKVLRDCLNKVKENPELIQRYGCCWYSHDSFIINIKIFNDYTESSKRDTTTRYLRLYRFLHIKLNKELKQNIQKSIDFSNLTDIKHWSLYQCKYFTQDSSEEDVFNMEYCSDYKRYDKNTNDAIYRKEQQPTIISNNMNFNLIQNQPTVAMNHQFFNQPPQQIPQTSYNTYNYNTFKPLQITNSNLYYNQQTLININQAVSPSNYANQQIPPRKLLPIPKLMDTSIHKPSFTSNKQQQEESRELSSQYPKLEHSPIINKNTEEEEEEAKEDKEEEQNKNKFDSMFSDHNDQSLRILLDDDDLSIFHINQQSIQNLSAVDEPEEQKNNNSSAKSNLPAVDDIKEQQSSNSSTGLNLPTVNELQEQQNNESPTISDSAEDELITPEYLLKTDQPDDHYDTINFF